MATFEELGDKYDLKLRTLSNFKIGKTGQTIEERYNEEYSDTYDYYEVIGSSENKSTIDNFEKYMIDRFSNLPKCNNDQIGGGEMVKSNKYIVYLVYNNQ